MLIWAGLLPAQTFLTGTVTNGINGEPVEFVQIQILEGEDMVFGTLTDEHGQYRAPVDPGTYAIKATYIGFADIYYKPVIANKDKINVQDLVFEEEGYDLPPAVVEVERPLVVPDQTENGKTIGAKELEQLPSRDVRSIIATTPKISSLDEGEPINIGGARSSGTVYYIDDIRVTGAASLVPVTEIQELKIITGGISPEYGDVTGGVIAITTKGMSNTWKGGVELESSQYLDAYGQHIINTYASGPLLKNKKGRSILGLRIGAQWNRKNDDRPSAIELPSLTDEAFERISSNPMILNGNSFEPTAAFLTDEDVQFTKYQTGETYERLDLSGKLTARLNPFMDISLGGGYINIKDQFTPRGNQATGTNWRVLNSRNNPTNLRDRYRANLRFRHRLGASWTDETNEKPKTGISYLQYNLIAGYEKAKRQLMDPHHQENLFNYGHVGQFDFTPIPIFSEDGLTHVDYREAYTGYQAGSINPLLANYNKPVDQTDYNSFLAVNGEIRSGSENVWGLHTNVNQVYNNYDIRNNDRITLATNFSFDVRPKKNGGIHGIKFGFQYEQQFNRGFQINPNALWVAARQLANAHISGLDSLVVIDSVFNNGNWVDLHPVRYNEDVQTTFDQNARALTGQSIDEFLNIDALGADQLSLGMFAPNELNVVGNNLNLNYWGYDYTGKLLNRKVGFNDFFTEVDEKGNRTFPVAAWEPNYFGFYLQDKFSFRDIYFSLGLRVDRYDANSKVLKDPYSLYEIMTADDFFSAQDKTVPEGVGSNYRVYTQGENSSKVVGYRLEDQWYNAEGDPVNSGAQIFGGEVVHPKLYEGNVNRIRAEGFDPNNSFEDYKPDWNFLPRIAFSFPISKDANFFAHYDILSQRPTATGINVSRVSALDYYNFELTQPVANANLKSQISIEYEVGFQQALGKKSALRMVAFYKELRNLIQRRTYLYLAAPITSYETYDNIDFGTVKGFSFEYNTKRMGNVQLNASYTLMFSDGTGSNADGRRGLSNVGNIRTLYPLDYDERHQLQGSIDFRYGSGKKYNGPRVAGKALFENMGINIQTTAISGRPYTAKSEPTVLDGNSTIGQINGPRLPWQNVLHLKINKYIPLSKEEDGPAMNIYLRIQNLFDQQNARQVYPATGSPSEDGYLLSTAGLQGQAEIEEDPDRLAGYLNAYQWRLINPNFFTLGRRIYFGATFQF